MSAASIISPGVAILLTVENWGVLFDALDDQRRRLHGKFVDAAETVARLHHETRPDLFAQYELDEAEWDLRELQRRLRRLNELIESLSEVRVG